MEDDKTKKLIDDIMSNTDIDEQIDCCKKVIDSVKELEDPQKGIESVSLVFAKTTIKKIAKACEDMGSERFIELCKTVPEFRQICMYLGVYAAIRQSTIVKLKKD